MRVVYSWLKEFLNPDLDLSAEDAAKILTAGGLEVEDHIKVGHDFSGVVVAKVVGKKKHPKADKLTLVDVVTQEGGAPTVVVCGANNVPEPGGRVLWAKPGAKLPGGISIGSKELKGVLSAGMLCALDELGIGDDHSGIVVLTDLDKAELGQEANECFGLKDDVFDLAMPANRADVLGHVGVARELSALGGGQFTLGHLAKGKAEDGKVLSDVSVEIKDSRCSRYIARKITGLKTLASPLWLQNRLRAVGVRPISNLVDVTNYVMFECGQPLHAFDANKLTDKPIVIREAVENEKIQTLDDEERSCSKGDLLICNGETPVAMAGVMGGASTQVDDGTSSIVLESAQFDPASIRKTSKAMGLHSESSHRFERFVDSEGSDIASLRAAHLLAELGGGKVSVGKVDSYPQPPKPKHVVMSWKRLADLTGIDIDKSTAEQSLVKLGFVVEGSDDTQVKVSVPSFRSDVSREVDLIEEVIRVYGFDKLDITLPQKTIGPSRPRESKRRLLRRALLAGGFHESVTFGFTSPKKIEAMGFAGGDPRSRPLMIDNPMSIEQSAMRTTLLPNLLSAVSNNLKQGSKDVALFEIGRVFLRDGNEKLPKEPLMMAALLSGRRQDWMVRKSSVDVFDVKGALETCFDALYSEGLKNLKVENTNSKPWMHPGVCADVVYDGQKVGVLGEIHPELREKFEIKDPVFALEINIDLLPKVGHLQMQTISKFPTVGRDISMFVDLNVSAQKVVQTIENIGEKLLSEARIVEDFRDPKFVPEGQKGMLWSLTYKSNDRTLTDKEVDKAHKVIESKVIQELGATKR